MFFSFIEILPDLIRRGSHSRHFVINHCRGTSPIVYSVDGWVKSAHPGNIDAAILSLLTTSNKLVVQTTNFCVIFRISNLLFMLMFDALN